MASVNPRGIGHFSNDSTNTSIQISRLSTSYQTAARYAVLTVVGALVCSSWGCGERLSGGRKAVNVRGTVKFEDQPVALGTILFVSDDNEHRAASAQIQNGSYSALVEPGVKRVEITATREVPGKFEEIPGPDGKPVRWPAQEMYVPAKYNLQTELKVTVPPEGASGVEFQLTP